MNTPRVTLGKMQNPVRGFLHGTAALVSLIGAIFLLSRASSGPAKVAVVVFSIGLVGLYTTSSLYHSIPWRESWKKRMQRIDHSMIFVLIASTYTPVAVLALDGWWTWATLSVVWGITLIGAAQHAFFPREEQNLSMAMMITMGWLAVFIFVPFVRNAGFAPAIWIAIGGIMYTVGVVFLITNRPRLWPRVFSYHEVFHILVIGGSISHWFMTYRYLAPLDV